MDLILKKDVENLGYKDDIVTVKNGYGRNFLVPHGYAVLASPSARKAHEETLKQRSHKQEKVMESAKANAEKLASAQVRVGAKVGENGKIFGSVNTVQVADALKKLGFDIDRKAITIKDEPIREVGTYNATVILHKEVKQDITFEVAED